MTPAVLLFPQVSGASIIFSVRHLEPAGIWARGLIQSTEMVPEKVLAGQCCGMPVKSCTVPGDRMIR
jgi:hypothetical protein